MLKLDRSDAQDGMESEGSAAMEESDSDEGPDEPDAQGARSKYPLEGKFMNEKDRAEILAKTEFEREAILADRAEEVQKALQEEELFKKHKQGLKKTKRKADAADIDDEDTPRKTSKAKRGETISSYKRQREQKEARRRDVDRRIRDRRSPSDERSDRDAEGESEVEWDDGRPAREEPTADLKDFERIRVGRTNFAKVCFYPTFRDAITGCFARVNIGVKHETGRNEYRMTQIKGTSNRLNCYDYLLIAWGRLRRRQALHDGGFEW